MAEVEDALLSVGQKAFIEKGGELLVLTDPVYGNDFPGGKVKDGEKDFPDALRREVREETGLEIEVLEPFNTWYFEWPPTHRNAGKKAIVVDYRCKYISGNVTLSDEHTKFVWVNQNNCLAHFKPSDIFYSSLQRYFKKN